MHQIGCWGPDTIRQMRDTGRKLLGLDGAPVDIDKAVAANGYGLFERENDDWSSCASFYLDQPTNNLPALAPVAERTVGLIRAADVQKRTDA